MRQGDKQQAEEIVIKARRMSNLNLKGIWDTNRNINKKGVF